MITVFGENVYISGGNPMKMDFHMKSKNSACVGHQNFLRLQYEPDGGGNDLESIFPLFNLQHVNTAST